MTYPRVQVNLDFEIGAYRPTSQTTVISAGHMADYRTGSALTTAETPAIYTSAIAAIRDNLADGVTGELWKNLLRVYSAGYNGQVILCRAEDATDEKGGEAIAALQTDAVRDATKPGFVLIDYAGVQEQPAASDPTPLASTIATALQALAADLGGVFVFSASLHPVPTATNQAAVAAKLNTWLASNYQNAGIMVPFNMFDGTDYGTGTGYITGALAYYDGLLGTNAYVTHYKELPDMQLPAITATPTGGSAPISYSPGSEQESIRPSYRQSYYDTVMASLVNAGFLGIFRHNGFHMAGNELAIAPSSLRGRTSERYIGVQRFVQRMVADVREIAQPYTGLPVTAANTLGMVQQMNAHEAEEVRKTRGFIASSELEFNRIENRIIYLTGRVTPIGPTEGIVVDITVGA